MNAIGLFGRKYIDVIKREYELGDIEPNDAIVQIKASGICGTDLQFLRYAEGEYHPIGHEISGVVIKIGTCVKNVKVGDKVVIRHITPCGICYNCQNGQTELCTNFINTDNYPGLATYYKINSKCLIKFDNLSFETASLVEPLAVGITTTINSNIPFGGSVLIFGHGTIGLFIAKCAKLYGANWVGIVGTGCSTVQDKARFNAAKSLGVNEIFYNINTLVQDIHRIFSHGVDRIIIASPPTTCSIALQCCKFGAQITILGLSFNNSIMSIDINNIVFNNITLKGIIMAPANNFNSAINLLITKQIDPTIFLTTFATFDNFSYVIHNFFKKTFPDVKICLIPN